MDAGGHPAIRRQLAHAQHALRELLTVNDQRQRAPQARIVLEGRARKIEPVEIGVQLRRDVQLAREVLLDPVKLTARHDGRDLQLISAVAR